MKALRNIRVLLCDSGTAVAVVNLISLYRIITFPVLIILLFTGLYDIFKWMLLISFITDAIDGYLARRYHATSVLGAKLDSIGDDLTVLAAIIGIVLRRWDFIYEQKVIFIILLLVYFVQLFYAFKKFGKISTFHTYLAKTAAVWQGIFLVSFFFLDKVIYPLFYLASVITICEIVEEILIIHFVQDPQTNVKGLYWVLKEKKKRRH